MKRAIIVPAPLSSDALDELKQWLAITGGGEDAALTALLRSALDLCEAYTGTSPLEVEAEEFLPATREWQCLASKPVGAIISAEGILPNGERIALLPGDLEFDITADGMGRARLLSVPDAKRIAVRFTAGLAPEWAALPSALRHGIIRFAAHHHRARDVAGDSRGGGGPGAMPPAAVTALWQPWRRMRLI